jgi:hypothetical protein
MTDTQNGFLSIAISPRVVKSAVRVSLLVGTILALINHGEAILALAVPRENLVQILLTYLVPYCVSTWSAVRAIQGSGGTA